MKKKRMNETMAVKTGDKNQEMTTGVNPLRKGNCSVSRREVSQGGEGLAPNVIKAECI